VAFCSRVNFCEYHHTLSFLLYHHPLHTHSHYLPSLFSSCNLRIILLLLSILPPNGHCHREALRSPIRRRRTEWNQVSHSLNLDPQLSIFFFFVFARSESDSCFVPCSENEKSGFINLVSRYLRWINLRDGAASSAFVLICCWSQRTLLLNVLQWWGAACGMEQDPDAHGRSGCALRHFSANSWR